MELDDFSGRPVGAGSVARRQTVSRGYQICPDHALCKKHLSEYLRADGAGRPRRNNAFRFRQENRTVQEVIDRYRAGLLPQLTCPIHSIEQSLVE